MSGTALAEVWSNSRQVGTDLVILLALATVADDRHTACLSVGELAAMARVTPRSVNRALVKLKAAGEIIDATTSAHGPRKYQINLSLSGRVHREL